MYLRRWAPPPGSTTPRSDQTRRADQYPAAIASDAPKCLILLYLKVTRFNMTNLTMFYRKILRFIDDDENLGDVKIEMIN